MPSCPVVTLMLFYGSHMESDFSIGMKLWAMFIFKLFVPEEAKRQLGKFPDNLKGAKEGSNELEAILEGNALPVYDQKGNQ